MGYRVSWYLGSPVLVHAARVPWPYSQIPLCSLLGRTHTDSGSITYLITKFFLLPRLNDQAIILLYEDIL
jgi:hypothetical protein